MEGLWQDLRYAVRLLRRTPRNSAIAVAILALGIGANTAMFSAVNHVLLRPLPFPDSTRLLRLRDATVTADGQLHAFNMAPRDLMVLRESTDIFDGGAFFCVESGSFATTYTSYAPAGTVNDREIRIGPAPAATGTIETSSYA